MISMKKLEDKLAKKKIRLKKLLEEKDKLEIKIKELRADIEKLQANQFEQFKKAAKRENIEIRIDDIPEILQLIKNLQQGESSLTDDVDENKIIRSDDLRTLDSLESISSFKSKN